MKHTTLAGLLLAVSGFTLATPPAADMTNGKRVVDTVCAACHGAGGNTNNATYLPNTPPTSSSKPWLSKMAIATLAQPLPCARRCRT